jgi:biotin carboxylase
MTRRGRSCTRPLSRLWSSQLTVPEAVADALLPLHRARPFGHVLSLTEKGLLAAAETRGRLGVPGNSLATVRRLKDKLSMRAALAGTGISPVAWSAPQDARQLREFCERVDGPVILKPSEGAGSRSVHRVDAPTDARTVWGAFSLEGTAAAIAEEMLSGPEISVETLTVAGRHQILMVTDKDVDDHFVELGHTMPSRLPDEVLSDVRAVVRAFLDAMGVEEGPTHTELKITERGPLVVESHDRIGGDRIRVLLELSLGIDVPALTVANALGLAGPLLLPPQPRGAAIRFLSARPGRVTSITIPTTTPRQAVHVRVGVGDVVFPVRKSDDRPGFVIADGRDADEAAFSAALLRDMTTIRTEAERPDHAR